MAPIPPAPQIEGALKSTINAIGFGVITTVLAVTFGRLFIPNFFVIIVSFVVFLEFVLLICIPKRKEQYELYQAPGRRGVHNIGGTEVPQINIQGPEATDGTPKKKQGVRARLKKDPNKSNKKDQLGVGGYDEDPDGASTSGGRGSPKRSPKMEQRKAAKDDGSKAAKDDESKAKEGKAESAQSSEHDDKSKGKGKGGWRKRLTSKSQSEESA